MESLTVERRALLVGASVVSMLAAAMVVLMRLGEADVVVVVKVVVLEMLVVGTAVGRLRVLLEVLVVIAAAAEATVASATVLMPDVTTELLEVDRLRVSHPLHVLSHSSTNSPHKPLPKIR